MSCPSVADLLLTVAERFGSVDGEGALARLDDEARSLFGIAALDGPDRVERLAHALGAELAYSPAGEEPESLLLDRVLERRRGHSLLLACVGHELARRAGVESAVFSLPGTWLVGCRGEDTMHLVALGDPPGPATGATPRRHCAHELAFATLMGLEPRYERAGDPARARLAVELRDELPLVGGGH